PNDFLFFILGQVNEVWAGLGYYRRAKMLHEGAKVIQTKHGGKLPNTAKGLLTLPGIGPYTAGAVSSIAFGECEPLVDGNVIRVLSRVRAIASDPKKTALNNLCWNLARELVDPDSPGNFNQALMELGATVCTVKSPSCESCPIEGMCAARALVRAGAGAGEGARAMRGGSVEGEGCICTVCELGEGGLVDIPSQVTDFPRKAVKM
ncbi:unnamed protein product, partial [Discosporangium mesarthrocarpum]